MSEALPISDTSDDQALIHTLGFPPQVESAVRHTLEAEAGGKQISTSTPTSMPSPWRIELAGDDMPGWALWDVDSNGGRRLWVTADGSGPMHTAVRWEPTGLGWARFRLPSGKWLSLKPRDGSHPLWGTCDVVTGGGGHAARLPVQDYLALTTLPPLDQPEALPPGGGAALLNFLATLMAGRGQAPIRYRGPYPTAHLFDALCRSFAWQSGTPQDSPATQRAALRARFSVNEWDAALDVAPEAWPSPSIDWLADPWTPLRPHPDVYVQWRRGPETIWIRGISFEAPQHGEAVSGGGRAWRVNGGSAAGLLLLGRPWRTFIELDDSGKLLHYVSPPDEPDGSASSASTIWSHVIWAWAVLNAPAALAGTVAALEEQVTVTWAALPASLAEVVASSRGPEVRMQSGIAEQFRALLARGYPSSELALLAVSDAASGAEKVLRRLAQQRLADSPIPDPAMLVTAGETAQARARQRLQRDLPALVARLTAQEGWLD